MMRQAMMFSKRGTSAAEVQALIDASAGGDQMPWVETCPHWAVTTASGAGANFPLFYRVRVAKAIAVSSIAFYVATQNGNADVGIYQSNGTTLTKIASSGSTAVGVAVAVQSIALTAAVTLQPGVDYYLALSLDSTASIGRAASMVSAPVAAADATALTKAAAFPLPASTTLASLSGVSNVYWLRAR
jgi:hypothetical protein